MSELKDVMLIGRVMNPTLFSKYGDLWMIKQDDRHFLQVKCDHGIVHNFADMEKFSYWLGRENKRFILP